MTIAKIRITEDFRFAVFCGLNPIPGGGGHYGPDDREQPGVSAGIGGGSPKFMTLFLLVPDRCQTSHFWIFFESVGKLSVKNFRGSSSIRQKIEKLKKKSNFLLEILLFLAESLLYIFSAFF